MKYILSFIFSLCSIISYGQYVKPIDNEITLDKTYITIGYNIQYKIPNYVGETLCPNNIITAVRESSFHSELDLPKQYRSYSVNYSNTNYDRGHMAPAADFKFNAQAMYDSFSMANIAPQCPMLNRNYWKNLETYVRKYVNTVDTLYIITGTICEKNKTINNKIWVPTKFYKAILGKYNNEFVISAAWIYNNSNKKQTIDETMCSINKVESLINRDLFYQICTDENVENIIKLK